MGVTMTTRRNFHGRVLASKTLGLIKQDHIIRGRDHSPSPTLLVENQDQGQALHASLQRFGGNKSSNTDSEKS